MWVNRKTVEAERQYAMDLENTVARMNGIIHSAGIIKMPPFIPQQPSLDIPRLPSGRQLETINRRIDEFEDEQ
jgi:hypothetical protein